MDAASPPVVGIDLGTTFSSVAYYDKGKRELIPDMNGDTLVMSFVYFAPDDGKVFVGKHAYDLSRHCPSNGIRDAKRIIGRKFDDQFVQQYIELKQTSSRIVNGANNMAMFALQICNQTVLKFPEDISAEILKYLKKCASSHLNTDIKEAVISVPAYFSNAQKKSTKKAAELAGIYVLKLITEPTAAAIYYIMDKHIKKSNLLVLDWGGGTLDISLIQVRGNVFEVKAVYGDTLLGGRNIDEALFKHFCTPVQNITQLFSRRLLEECVTLKESLTVVESIKKCIDYYDGRNDLTISMNIKEFEKLTNHILERVIAIVQHAMRDSGWSTSDIDHVVLVGGSTRIPKIRNMLKSIFNKNQIKTDLNPDTAVASGASIQSYLLKLCDMDFENYKITEVTPLSLGVGLYQDLMNIFIPRNSPLPFTMKYCLRTVQNNQSACQFVIYEGERKNIKYNNKLGELELNGLPLKRAGDVNIDVIFHLDEDGILTVKASEKSTGTTKALSITMGEFRLSEKKIEYSKTDAAKYKIEDEVFEKFARLKSTMNERCQHILYDIDRIKETSSKNVVTTQCEHFLSLLNKFDYTESNDLERHYKAMYDRISEILINNNMMEIMDK